MKKELEDQKASLKKHEIALEQSKTDNAKLREELRKEFRDKMEKERIAHVELRKANAAKRQSDIAEITRNFIDSKIEKHLANSAETTRNFIVSEIERYFANSSTVQ